MIRSNNGGCHAAFSDRAELCRVRWLFSFLSPDKRKTYCLYEAPNAEAIRMAARRANIPADVVIEVSELRPEMFA